VTSTLFFKGLNTFGDAGQTPGIFFEVVSAGTYTGELRLHTGGVIKSQELLIRQRTVRFDLGSIAKREAICRSTARAFCVSYADKFIC
jgi:hypothetical protein